MTDILGIGAYPPVAMPRDDRPLMEWFEMPIAARPTPATCGTCAWWRRHEEDDDRWSPESRLFGDCECPRLAYGHVSRNDDNRAIVWSAVRPPPNKRSEQAYREDPVETCTDMLLYEDYSSYAATLETGQDFGCIHWRAREAS